MYLKSKQLMIRKPVLRRHSGSFLRPKFAFGFRVISVAVVVRDPDLIARQFHSAPVSIVGWPWCSVQTVQRSELVCRLSYAVGRDSHTRHIHSATLRASLSGTFLQTLPDFVTPLKGHSLSPRSCPATRSAPSERFWY